METIEEIWKPIPNYEGFYEVSNHGRVLSLEREYYSGYYGKSTRRTTAGIKAQVHNKHTGYFSTRLSKDGAAKRFTIHELVATVFLPRPEWAQCVNHIDGNKENNHVSNLEWSTFKANVKHAFRTGLRCGSMKDKFGKQHNRSKHYEPK